MAKQTIGVNKFIGLLDVDAINYNGLANDIIVVNPSETGVQLVAPGAILPPIVGTGTMGDIPVWNDPLSIPPIFVDSGIGAGQIPPPLAPTITGQYIDMDKAANPTSQLLAFVTVPGPQKVLALVANAQNLPTADADLAISNNSVTPKDISISNQSGSGLGGDVSVYSDSGNINLLANAGDILLSEGINNNSIGLNSTNIFLQDSVDNNFININSGGISSVVLGAGQNNVMSTNDGSCFIQSTSGGCTIQELTGNNKILIDSNKVNLIQTPQSHQLLMDNIVGVQLSAGTGMGLQLNAASLRMNNYYLPTLANGIANQVMLTDALDNLSFVDASSLPVVAVIQFCTIVGGGQVIGPSSSALMTAAVSFDGGLGTNWVSPQYTSLGAVEEFNLTFSTSFGSSVNLNVQLRVNGFSNTSLNDVNNGTSSISQILNNSPGAIIDINVVNSDLVLPVTIDNMLLTVKKLGPTLP